MSRYHRRVTLSPSPDDEGGQAFGWGTTLVSTLHGGGGGVDGGDDDSAQEDQDGDDHIEWRHFNQKELERETTTTSRPPLIITGSEVVPASRQPHQVSNSNEISTLRYYNDVHYDGYASGREGLGLGIQARGERELSPPVRHPHRPLSVDRRSSSYNSGWGAGSSTNNNNNNNIVVTTTTSTTSTPAANRPRTTTWTGGGGSNSNSSRTIRYYDPDVLRWHEKADEESSSPPLPTASPISQHQGQPAHHHKNVMTGTTTARGNSSNDDDDNNMIEEVVRAIHASRTGPFPGLSHGHRGLGVGGGGAGNGNSNESPSASSSVYEEELLLSGGQGLGRGGHTTNTTAVSNGSGGNNNSRIPRLPNPPANLELNKHNNKPMATFNNNSRSQQTSASATAAARTATHRQSQETNRDTFGSRQMSSGQRSVVSNNNNNNGESSHLQPPRSVEHVEQQQARPVSHLPRLIATERGGSGASHHTAQANTTNATANNNNKQDTHHQGERAIRRTSITRIPGANLVDVPRRGGDVGKGTDSRRLSTSRSDFPYQDRTTELGGGQGGFFAPSVNNSNGLQHSHASSSVADNSGIREPQKTTQVGAASAGMEGGTSNQQKTTATTTKGGRGTTGILTAAHAASPRENNASHSPHDFAVAHTATTTSSGDNKGPSNTQVRPHSLPAQHQHSDVDTTTTTAAGVPPASTHHGQHALFTNLPEPEKAHYPQTRGLGYRFREASLSTVGSIFKPEQRRQSSVTVLGDDADPQPVDAERYRDEAWDFLLRYRTERIVDVGRQPSYLRRLRWRIDLHLMVFLFLAYLVTFLDKILFNVSLPPYLGGLRRTRADRLLTVRSSHGHPGRARLYRQRLRQRLFLLLRGLLCIFPALRVAAHQSALGQASRRRPGGLGHLHGDPRGAAQLWRARGAASLEWRV